MTIFTAFAIFITIAALASFVNHRYFKLPTSLGVMIVGMIMSVSLFALSYMGADFIAPISVFLNEVDFSETLMKGMLSFLLFAGALHINLDDLFKQKYIIGLLATIGVVVTTFLVGTALYFILGALGLEISYVYCLVFGALIAPTDPVAVIAILKSVKISKTLETKIAGESLFNDGVGIVVFGVVAGIAVGGSSTTALDVSLLFLQEAVGGVILGLALGWLTFQLLRRVDDHSVEILLTLALVCGGYSLAIGLHTSGPIAIVVAGLLIGNHGRRFAMSDHTIEHLDKFWEFLDETLNAALFVWIGLEAIALSFSVNFLIAGLIAIPLTLLARLLSVWGAINALKFRREFSDNAVRILTWGGLRGGISIALALSLPASETRDLIVAMTYIVVVFSILVQGLTIKKVLGLN
ncbi:MAG: sodium:proton antiporter [candidate division Zixibacteria bacterium]|nr:sodium:proton antiporter [candidate division Zixibacteria bacterium]